MAAMILADSATGCNAGHWFLDIKFTEHAFLHKAAADFDGSCLGFMYQSAL